MATAPQSSAQGIQSIAKKPYSGPITITREGVKTGSGYTSEGAKQAVGGKTAQSGVSGGKTVSSPDYSKTGIKAGGIRGVVQQAGQQPRPIVGGPHGQYTAYSGNGTTPSATYEARAGITPKAAPSTPEQAAAYNIAQAAAGSINRQLGGQEYVMVTQQGESYVVEPNPNITAPQSLKSEIERLVLAGAAGRDVKVSGSEGRFTITGDSGIQPTQASSAPVKPTYGSAKAQEAFAGFASRYQERKLQSSIPPGYEITGGRATKEGAYEYILTPIQRQSKAGPEDILTPEQGVRRALTASQGSRARPAAAASELQITTPTHESPFLGATGLEAGTTDTFRKTPTREFYGYHIGPELQATVFSGTLSLTGSKQAAETAALITAPASYYAETSFELIKTGMVATSFPLAAVKGGEFIVREKAAEITGISELRPTQAEREFAISEFSGAVQYAPALPFAVVPIAHSILSPIMAPPAQISMIPQGRIQSEVVVKTGPGQFRIGVGTEPYTRPTQAMTAEQLVKANRLGITPIVDAGPVAVETTRYLTFLPPDPASLAKRGVAEYGAAGAGLEAGRQTVENIGDIAAGQQPRGYDPGKIAVAGVGAAAIVYPASKYVPLGLYQRSERPLSGFADGGRMQLNADFARPQAPGKAPAPTTYGFGFGKSIPEYAPITGYTSELIPLPAYRSAQVMQGQEQPSRQVSGQPLKVAQPVIQVFKPSEISRIGEEPGRSIGEPLVPEQPPAQVPVEIPGEAPGEGTTNVFEQSFTQNISVTTPRQPAVLGLFGLPPFLPSAGAGGGGSGTGFKTKTPAELRDLLTTTLEGTPAGKALPKPPKASKAGGKTGSAPSLFNPFSRRR